jgi:amino acid permease
MVSDKKIFPALMILVGTTIGAGFLGIPYVVSKAGFVVGVVSLIVVAAFILLLQLYLGEVMLRTKGTHQLTGYAEKYLGKKGKYLMFFSLIFGVYSALIAYLIGEGQSLSYLFFGSFQYAIYFSLGFWLLLAVLSYIGLKALKKYEQRMMIFVFFMIALIVIVFSWKINPANLSYVDFSKTYLPLGVILFSFLAFSAMPEVRRVIRKGNEGSLKKVIFYGVLIPFIIYIIFMTVVVGVFNNSVSEIATFSLGRFFTILSVVTMFNAFFAQTIAIRDVFRFDFKLGRLKGWALAIFITLILFIILTFFKLADFINLLSIAGVVSAGVTGILILLMNKKAKEKCERKPEYCISINWLIIFLLSALLIAGIVLELIR